MEGLEVVVDAVLEAEGKAALGIEIHNLIGQLSCSGEQDIQLDSRRNKQTDIGVGFIGPKK